MTTLEIIDSRIDPEQVWQTRDGAAMKLTGAQLRTLWELFEVPYPGDRDPRPDAPGGVLERAWHTFNATYPGEQASHGYTVSMTGPQLVEVQQAVANVLDPDPENASLIALAGLVTAAASLAPKTTRPKSDFTTDPWQKGSSN